MPGVEAYAADHNGYTGVTLGKLQASYDAGIKNIRSRRPSATTYCIQSTVGSYTFKNGPGDGSRLVPVRNDDKLRTAKGAGAAPFAFWTCPSQRGMQIPHLGGSLPYAPIAMCHRFTLLGRELRHIC